MKSCKTIPAVLILSLAFLIAGSTAGEKPESTRSGIAAGVNGISISENEVQLAVDTIIPQGMFHKAITNEKREQFRKLAIDYVIERELLFQEGKRLGIDVKKSEIKTVFEKEATSFKKKKDFYAALEKYGLNEDNYKEIIKKEILMKKVLEQEVEEKIVIVDADLEKYYNENKSKFLKPEGMRIREILISFAPNATASEKEERRKKAETLLQRLKAGEDFAALAYDNSDDDYRVKGGDLGIVHKGRLLPELEDAALKMEIGRISGLIETIYGYHIIKLEAKEPARQLSFSDIKESLKKERRSRVYDEKRDELMRRLREKAKIEVY